MATQNDLGFQIKNSNNNMIFLAGKFENFTAFNLANDLNYSYLDFNSFLKENNIDSELFSGTDKETNINISIDKWTQKIAYREQKLAVIIDGFDPKKVSGYLIRGLLMQELLYLSKNQDKLKTKLIFIVDLNKGELKNQILPKILANSLIIEI